MQKASAWPPLKRGLVAILRGITPDMAVPVAEILAEAGFEAIEVPLNSPQPIDSISAIVTALDPHILVGGGTMLNIGHVEQVASVGGRLMVSPNVVPEVIAHAAARGMVVMPGVLTPTEAFAALDAGASGLKLFPASLLGPSGVSALSAVLPQGTVLAAVGGVRPDNMADYMRAGLDCFGIGTAVFRPGDTVQEVADKAARLVCAYDRARNSLKD